MDCPVCQTTDIEETQEICPTCGYDISPYALNLVEISHTLIEKEQQRIAWARKLWAESQDQIAQDVETQDFTSLQTDDELDRRVREIEQLTEIDRNSQPHYPSLFPLLWRQSSLNWNDD
jgi:uncharacterized Zn finger protein (UPF0148 family)